MTKKKKQEPVFRFNLTLTKLDHFHLTYLHNLLGLTKTALIREAVRKMYDDEAAKQAEKEATK